MARRCKSGAALIFTAMVLAGCALVDSVIEIEPVREAARVVPRKAALAEASLSSGASRCGPGQLNLPGCANAQALSRASSAKYDSGPVLKPIKKGQEKKLQEPDDSVLVKAVKNWFRTGMQLHSWMSRQ